MINDTRRRAYSAGARSSRERMMREAPLDAAALARVNASDIVVVRGSYDHVELVLSALELPHTAIQPEQLGALELRPEQLLVINCPGTIGARGVERVSDFVARGGSLFSTDWAIRNVIERAFPGVLAYNERPTADAVVRIEIAEHDNPFLTGVMDAGDDPLWWLEGASYPITVLDPARVQVLIRSDELAAKWGESAVAVTFRHGAGEVFHMISHYFLQRTETRTARHRGSAKSWAASKGVADGPDLAGLTVSDVESAASSARMLGNWVATKKRARG